jgi:predicted lipoprotein with Yx(FWY)xxD motif
MNSAHSQEGDAMNRKITLALATAALGVLTLAGCSQSGGSGGGLYGGGASSAPPSISESAAPSASGAGELQTATSSLGTIVVDGKGMTVYVFDKDTAGNGKSVCEGDCLVAWPAVVGGADTKATGVTGTIGSITRTDGTKQVTLNGWPLYTYKGDAAKGNVNGQGVSGIWWVVGPDGNKMTGAATSGY